MARLLKRAVKSLCRRMGLREVVHTVRVERYAVVEEECLKGKNVLVTGGSGGIGLAIAGKCLACGARVLVTGRNEDKLRGAKAHDGSGRLQTLAWDVTDFDSLQTKVDEVFRAFGGQLDILVNNAGISIRQSVGSLTFDVWDAIVATNLKAPVFVAQAVAARWKEQKRSGVILNISSMAGVEPAMDAYSAAKCALGSMTKGMAAVFAHDGIRVNALAPGVVVGTDLRDLQRSVDPAGDVHCDWIPAGRYGVPEEIAEMAAFLVSDRTAYLTGAVIVCDGAGSLRQWP